VNLGLGILLILTTTIIVAVTETSNACSQRHQFLCTDLFKAPNRTLLSNGEMEFTRLGASKLSMVRISPTDAIRIAESQYGGEGRLRIVFESLGGFVDKNQIIPDWAGTTSWVPKAIPTYVVRIRDDHMVTVEPSTNHYWNVIVSAVSGKLIASFTYD
jgi:hypothetical protein